MRFLSKNKFLYFFIKQNEQTKNFTIKKNYS